MGAVGAGLASKLNTLRKVAQGGVAAAEAAAERSVISGAQTAMERQFARDGVRSLQSTVRNLTKNIAEHEALMAEYRAAGGNVASMEKEVRAWRETIKAAEKILEANP